MTRFLVSLCFVWTFTLAVSAAPLGAGAVKLTVTSELALPNAPLSAEMNFPKLIQQAGLKGVLDPNSISVVNLTTGQPQPCVVSRDFDYGDTGRVQWVIADPEHREYEIRFATVATRSARVAPAYVPQLGIGDLLMYNAGAPRPLGTGTPVGLLDLTGDGKRDLVTVWNYPYRTDEPWDGLFCFPRVEGGPFRFTPPVRLRHVASPDAKQYKHFTPPSHYMGAALADLNGDGRLDIVYRPYFADSYSFYLNAGDRDEGGMPRFAESGSVARPKNASNRYGEFRVVDLDGDGALDVMVRGTFLQKPEPTRLAGKA